MGLGPTGDNPSDRRGRICDAEIRDKLEELLLGVRTVALVKAIDEDEEPTLGIEYLLMDEWFNNELSELHR
jgi:hypothetical protein